MAVLQEQHVLPIIPLSSGTNSALSSGQVLSSEDFVFEEISRKQHSLYTHGCPYVPGHQMDN